MYNFQEGFSICSRPRHQPTREPHCSPYTTSALHNTIYSSSGQSTTMRAKQESTTMRWCLFYPPPKRLYSLVAGFSLLVGLNESPSTFYLISLLSLISDMAFLFLIYRLNMFVFQQLTLNYLNKEYYARIIDAFTNLPGKHSFTFVSKYFV